MEKWQRLHITTNLSRLQEDTNCHKNLLSILLSANVFAKADVEEIETEKEQLSRSSKLYSIIQTRSNGYDELIKALVECQQSGAAKILQQGQTAANCSDSLDRSSGDKHASCQAEIKQLKDQLERLTAELDRRNNENRNDGVGDRCSDIMYIHEEQIVKKIPGMEITIQGRRYKLQDIYHPIRKELDRIKQDIVAQIKTQVKSSLDAISKISLFNVQLTDEPVYVQRRLSKDSINTIMENELRSLLIEGHESHMCISAPLGMGKTSIIRRISKELAGRVDKNCAQHIVLFIQIKKFISKYNESRKEINIDNVRDLIADCTESTDSPLAKQLSRSLLCNKMLRFELFFDGYDDLGKDVERGNKLLQCIIENFKEARIFVSTRPEMCAEAEKTLGVTAADLILPFTSDDQIEFLTSFWLHSTQNTHQQHKDSQQILKSVATEYISQFKQQFSFSTENMMDNHLLCKTFGEVCLPGVKKLLSAKTFNSENLALPCSIFHVFKPYMEKRFQLGMGGNILQVKYVHYYAALQQTFPDIDETKFQNIFDKIATDDSIFAPGILRRGNIQVTSTSIVNPNIAQYLVADLTFQLITGNLDGGPVVLEFVMETVLQSVRSFRDHIVGDKYCTRENIIDIIRRLNMQEHSIHTWTAFARHIGLSEYHISHLITDHRKDSTINVFDYILHQWMSVVNNGASLEILFAALKSEGWTNISDSIHERLESMKVQETEFKHPIICSFLNGFVKEQLDEGNTALFQPLKTMYAETANKRPATFASSIFDVFLNCVKQGNSSLVELFACIIPDDNDEFKKALSSFPWQKVLSRAAKYSTLECFRCLLTLAERFGKKFSDMCFKKQKRGEAFVTITPLHEAIQQGNYEVSDYLIDSYKTMESFSNLKCLLHYCVGNTYKKKNMRMLNAKLKVIQRLINTDKGRLLNEKSPCRNQRTPILMFGIHFKILKFLLEQKPDVKRTLQSNRQTIAHICPLYLTPGEYHEFVEKLIKMDHSYILFERETDFGRTAIHMALQYLEIQPDTLRHILSIKMTSHVLNMQAYTGNNALFHAIIGGKKVEIFKILKDKGVRVRKMRNKFGQSILHIAALYGNVDAIKYFADLGAEVDARDNDKRTPLHLAVREGRKDKDKVIQALLKVSADVNAEDSSGATPLSDSRNPNYKIDIETSGLPSVTVGMRKGYKLYYPKSAALIIILTTILIRGFFEPIIN